MVWEHLVKLAVALVAAAAALVLGFILVPFEAAPPGPRSAVWLGGDLDEPRPRVWFGDLDSGGRDVAPVAPKKSGLRIAVEGRLRWLGF